MTDNLGNLHTLMEPFAAADLEWRILECSVRNERIVARVAPRVKVPALIDRLDRAAGQAGWRCSFDSGPAGGVICTLDIRVGDEWIARQDVGERARPNDPKAAASDAFKRAVGRACGLARYLWSSGPLWAQVSDRWKYHGRTPDGRGFRWDPPVLP